MPGIYEAMAKIMREMEAVPRSKQSQQGAVFRYRGIDDIYNALHPLLGKHGVFVLPVACERTATEKTTKTGAAMEVVMVKMAYRFCHEDGSAVECQAYGEAMDSGDKATSKAMAMAHKYALLQTFCMPTEDMDETGVSDQPLYPDPFGQRPEPATEKQRHAVCAAMKARFGEDKAQIMDALARIVGRRVESTADLSKKEASQVLDAVKAQTQA